MPADRSALLTQGHRPFFLAAAAFGALHVPWWSAALEGWLPPPPPLGAALGHAHEMIFGYLVAVFAGFLLIGTRGPRLALLLGLWLAGRIAMLAAGQLPTLLVALLDLAFLPALALLRLPSLRASLRWPQAVFLPLLLALFAANLAFHLDALGLLPGAARAGQAAALDLLALMILVVAGRLVPGYTRATLPHLPRPRDDRLERVALALLLAAALLRLVERAATPAAALRLLLALVLAERLRRWQPLAVRGQPLLWILHAGYGWLALAQALDGAQGLGAPLAGTPAVHALGVGAIGSLTQGMMVRLARQHARRPLRADGCDRAAFLLVTLAALARVVLPLLLPGQLREALGLAAATWSLAFFLFLWGHAGPLAFGMARPGGRQARG